MRRLILLGLALVLVLCACQNSLKIEPTELDGVSGTVMINRGALKVGDSYAVGYGNGNILSDRVRMSWQRCTDENFLCYKLFRDGIVKKTILNPAITECIDSLLMQDSEYDYRFVCVLKNGMAVDDTITIKTPEFLLPNQFNYNLLTPTSVYLTWNNRAETATGYVIEKYVFATDETIELTSEMESYTDNQILEGGAYRYRVKAMNQYESTGYTSWLAIGNPPLFDFEADDGAFTATPASGWQHGQSTVCGANSGVMVWGTALNGDYVNNADYRLYSPVINVPAGAVLEFYHCYGIENNYDGGNVKISTNNGATWTLITPEGEYTQGNIYSSNEPGYCGFQQAWMPAVFDLSAYAGQDVKFMWRFTSDGSVVYPGWYIDDVRVGPDVSKALAR